MPDPTYGETDNNGNITLSSQIPAKSGFIFRGWCTAYTTSNYCTGTTYQPGDPYPADTDTSIGLYAMWEADCNALLCMQKVDEWKDTLTLEKQYLTVDTRDNKMYWVALLRDNNIWMTQNLDLDLNTNRPLTSNDTDLNEAGSGAYVAGYTNTGGVIEWVPAASTVVATANNIGSFGWESSSTIPSSADTGNWYENGEFFENSTSCSYFANGCQYISSTPYTTNGTHGHIGNYYNWTALVASNNSTNLNTRNEAAANSICPKGWKLPVKSSNGSFQSLYGRYENYYMEKEDDFFYDRVLFEAPIYFVRAGYIETYKNLNNSGVYMHYYTNTVYGSNNSYKLFASYWTMAYNDYSLQRNYGGSARCLAR